jgi:predicted ribonuclease YlaK
MNAEVVKDCLSKSNVASLYARHRVAAQAYFRKIDRLVDCSMVSSRQSNRRRVGDATVMDLVIELRRRLDGADTVLALSELPTRVQAAADQLKEAAESYAAAVQHL